MDYHVQRSLRWGVTLLVVLSNIATAQITVSSSSGPDNTSNTTYGGELGVSSSANGSPDTDAVFVLAGITQDAIHTTPSQALRGTILETNPSNLLTVSIDDIALISCDSAEYEGNLGAANVVGQTITDQNATAVILYSILEQSCTAGGLPDTAFVYTMTSQQDSEALLGLLNGATRYGTIAPRGTFSQMNDNGTSTSTNNNNNQNPWGPSPSTAVAMIILYSITGVITALFLLIIIMGAVRAHRHPERYGPRAGIGRPRQSRARGLARAMLETIPIVKFGDREGDQQQKPADVELAEANHGSVEMPPEQNKSPASAEQSRNIPSDNPPQENSPMEETLDNEPESGIAAAASVERPKTPTDNQGCSICTEDFEVGQDQRVLPCNHRFHPECIDPWLLNVSGTCPLCRIDLNPQETADAADAVDENGNTVQQDGTLAPPLEIDANRRMSIRRSLLIGLMGSRPERATREQRLQALRQYREQHRARQQSDAPSPPEEESTRRRRFRSTFHIRTRRTGPDGQAGDVPEQ